MKVFLGGTCNNSSWRDVLIGMLGIDYFNPVVDDWTEECMAEEIRQRESCNFVLYVITPLMTGVYAIAEVVDDSNKRPDRTLFCYLEYDRYADSQNNFKFTEGQLKSLGAVAKMVRENGATVFRTLAETANFLNEKQ